jgi:hypothetical protein
MVAPSARYQIVCGAAMLVSACAPYKACVLAPGGPETSDHSIVRSATIG